MKVQINILGLLLFLSSFNILASNESSSINDQYLNRNWSFQAYDRAFKARNISYFDMDIISQALHGIDNFLIDLKMENIEDLSLFYPTALLSNEESVLRKEIEINNVASKYKVFLKWDNLFIALASERWEDLDESCQNSTNPLSNPSCGRKSRGNYAIAHLTSIQRQTLDELKNAIFEELDYIKTSKADELYGPGPAMIFQFLYDARSIDKLIQPSYVSKSDPLNSELRKKNIIEIGRALIIQIFQDKNGRLLNSDLNEIKLEDSNCYLPEVSSPIDCQLDYLKLLVWDPKIQNQNQLITNLILDPKGIKSIFDSLIQKFTIENGNDLTREQMIEFMERAYLSLCVAYDVNPMTPEYSDEFMYQFKKQIVESMNYLINKRNIVGLKIARGLQELDMYLEGL